MIDISAVTTMHRDMVARWHQHPVEVPFEGYLGVACQQHAFNFLLWHEEDIARSPNVGDERIAQVKRAIDRYNQQRNDWIEKLDDWISDWLQQQRIEPMAGARLNTETPGSVIDRLSILSLRIYHLQEQCEREDATPEHIESVRRKLAICFVQHDDLSQAFTELLEDIVARKKRHRTYRQLKMYNDPTLNPYLYRAQQATTK